MDNPQYVGCQHHILDLILRHLLNFIFPAPTQKPEIEYVFVDKICSQYDNLQRKYVGEEEVPSREILGWRSDFKFLFELCEAYKVYHKGGKFQIIKWRSLPSLHSARWNSRATFSLIAFFLLPEHRDQLSDICYFISTAWASAWFSNQHFADNVFQDIYSAVSKFGCQKATKCFQTHWVKEPSVIVIDVPRSNIVAERAVKIMEEIHSTCKSDKYLNLKFVNSNLKL